jgi:hypothetical protein
MRIPKIGEKVNIKSDSLIYKIFDVSQDLLVVKVSIQDYHNILIIINF